MVQPADTPGATTWRASKRAALDAWRAGMSSVEAAAYEDAKAAFRADRDRRRAARAARAAEREAFDRRVLAGVLAGRTTDEIAAEIGSPAREVRRVCARLGVERGKPGFRRLPAAQVPVAIRAQIETVAAERGTSPAETVATLLVFAFEENAHHARRLLRVPAAR